MGISVIVGYQQLQSNFFNISFKILFSANSNAMVTSLVMQQTRNMICTSEETPREAANINVYFCVIEVHFGSNRDALAVGSHQVQRNLTLEKWLVFVSCLGLGFLPCD